MIIRQRRRNPFIARFAGPALLLAGGLAGLNSLQAVVPASTENEAAPHFNSSSLTALSGPNAGAAQLTLTLDPNSSEFHWTLGATAHAVHGTFKFSKGSVEIEPVTGKASGEIVVTATSGESGNDGRDKKMHNEVLESARYPDIVFRPDRVEGKLATAGSSSVQLHGVFALHGASHEVTLPVQAELAGDQWKASSKFSVPYVQWGLKNPSNFFLRVKQEVEIELNLQGQLHAAAQ